MLRRGVWTLKHKTATSERAETARLRFGRMLRHSLNRPSTLLLEAYGFARESVFQQICQFVLDDFHCFEDFVLVTCAGNHHLAAAENQADDLRIVKSVDEAWELLWLVFDLVERQVEGQVVQIQFTRDAGLWLASELVVTRVIFRVVKGVGSNHVLDFNLDLVEVPCFDACCTKVIDHALNTGMDVVLVLSTCANSTAGPEHEDCQFWIGDTVHDTRELFWFVFTIQLNCDVW